MDTASPFPCKKTGNSTTLEALEPCGAHIQLRDLLRWKLAAPYIPLENRRNSSVLIGGRRSVLRGRGIDFDEVRLYQAGDDVRAIDWRVTARTGKAHTKMFREEKERPVLLVIDLRSTMFFGSRRCFKSVLAAHAAALLSWATLEAGDRIGALLVSDNGITDIRPQRSRHTLLQLLRQIIALDGQTLDTTSQRQQPPSWQHVVQQLRAVIRPGSCVIMISDFHDWNPECHQTLHPTVRHSQCFALAINDTLEDDIPAIGMVRLRTAVREAIVDTHNTKWLTRYRGNRLQHQQTVAAAMQSLKIPLLSLQTGQPLFPALRLFFSHGKQTGAAS